MRIVIDTREPGEGPDHPWAAFWPEGTQIVRHGLETGDVALAALPDGTLADVLTANHARGLISEAAIVGTVASWTRRGAPVLFAGTVHAAADLAYRFLAGQVKEIRRASWAIKTEAAA